MILSTAVISLPAHSRCLIFNDQRTVYISLHLLLGRRSKARDQTYSCIVPGHLAKLHTYSMLSEDLLEKINHMSFHDQICLILFGLFQPNTLFLDHHHFYYSSSLQLLSGRFGYVVDKAHRSIPNSGFTAFAYCLLCKKTLFWDPVKAVCSMRDCAVTVEWNSCQETDRPYGRQNICELRIYRKTLVDALWRNST